MWTNHYKGGYMDENNKDAKKNKKQGHEGEQGSQER